VPLVLLLLLVPIVVMALMPVMLIQRYRAGKARRPARPWLATLNVAVMVFSAVFFLATALFSTVWVPRAFTGAVIGMAAGVLLGGIGIAITRWESTPRSLHYTPNRWLVLVVTLIVTVRVLFGLYRSVAVARAGLSGSALVSAFGVPETLAAGAMVIGYYLAYNAGLRWRIHAWQRRALRPLNS
jgi:hypothetical protein